MNTLKSLKCVVVLLPVLAMGLPMAYAGDEKQSDSRQATSHHHFLETMPVGGYRSDSLIGQEVMNLNTNESIGKVGNLLLDQNDQVVAVIISVGGVLGIGKRDVAIALDQFERRVDGDKSTLWTNLTEQNLKDAPEYASETALSRRDQQRSDSAEKRADQVADRAEKRADQRQVTAHHHYLETLPVRGYHSGSLVGHDLKSRTNNETIGTVRNLLLDENGQVVAVVVGVGGLMGLGQRDVAIAWDQVERSFDGDEVTLWVNMTEEHLNDAPNYSSETTRPRSRR
jgi:sporulation protein YlmC with PRC-barrel domain